MNNQNFLTQHHKDFLNNFIMNRIQLEPHFTEITNYIKGLKFVFSILTCLT
jgi:hypothetical protein